MPTKAVKMPALVVPSQDNSNATFSQPRNDEYNKKRERERGQTGINSGKQAPFPRLKKRGVVIILRRYYQRRHFCMPLLRISFHSCLHPRVRDVRVR